MDVPPPTVLLVPFEDGHRDAFIREEPANHAEEQIRGSGFGRAMLNAVEDLLAREGFEELP